MRFMYIERDDEILMEWPSKTFVIGQDATSKKEFDAADNSNS